MSIFLDALNQAMFFCVVASLLSNTLDEQFLFSMKFMLCTGKTLRASDLLKPEDANISPLIAVCRNAQFNEVCVHLRDNKKQDILIFIFIFVLSGAEQIDLIEFRAF